MEIRWTPGIGDPTVSGWITVLAYFMAAHLSLRASRQAKLSNQTFQRDVVFWGWATVMMVAFGINKQLDLQALMTEIARFWALQDGWYDDRRGVQKIAIAVLVTGIGGAALLVSFLLRRSSPEAKVGAIGLVMVLLFVLIRAASFHHVDAFIMSTVFGLNWNTVLEVPGILILGISAARYRWRVNSDIRSQKSD